MDTGISLGLESAGSPRVGRAEEKAQRSDLFNKDKGTSRGKGKSKGKSKGKAAGVPRQGGSEAARRVGALEAGDYDATGLEEVDLAERFTRSLLEDASEGY